jgi:FKBP-type peptidyl-prolyl cis-trans isomerase FklB
MKKILFVAVAISIFNFQFSIVSAQQVKIKKGKVTMSEEYYNSLMAQTAQLDAARARIAELEAKLARPAMKNFNDSASYAIGRDMYTNWTQRQLGIDAKMAAQAMLDDANGYSQLSDAQAAPLLQRFQMEFERKQRAGVQENIDAGAKYLQQISNNKSVYTTPSGLKYRKIKDGNGKKPKATDRVRVHYTGTLIDGTKFDSSVDRGKPIDFRLNEVIPGWTEGLQLMDEGSKYMLYIPYNLGYGEQPAGSIPPGSTLIFEVELLEINPK